MVYVPKPSMIPRCQADKEPQRRLLEDHARLCCQTALHSAGHYRKVKLFNDFSESISLLTPSGRHILCSTRTMTQARS